MDYVTLLLIVAVLPAIILGIIVYRNDKIEKESAGLLTKLFFCGIGAVVITIIISLIISFLFPFIEEYSETNTFVLVIYSFLNIALIEEGSKYFFLKRITWNNKEFNHIYDAIVYASFVSLGFATIENILYVLSSGLTTGLVRAVLSVPAHLFFGIFMGYFYGLSKQSEINANPSLVKKNKFLSLFVPIIIHGLFDFCLLSGSVLFLIIFGILVIFLYIKAFSTLKKVSKVQENLIQSEHNSYCYMCGTKLTGEFCHMCGTKNTK